MSKLYTLLNTIISKVNSIPIAINAALAQAKASGEFDGYTPQIGVDYWTAADQEAIVQQVITALGTPVFGRVDLDKNIYLSGELVDGTYTFHYVNEDGSTTEIGNLALSSGPVEIPLTWEHGAVLDKVTGMVVNTGSAQYSASGYVTVDANKSYTLTRESYMHNTCSLIWYDSTDTFISYVSNFFDSTNASGSGGNKLLSYQLTPPANATKFRLRLWYEVKDATTTAAYYKLFEE